ncbi:MAG: type II toxin-antitoxin system RelB/DinJ family antitoxin [Desulfovibrio sp.]|jgi:DNA-damage-inducible protein J|nr:type II toxin-antitoxin system RelB/DinJ family antitoxin [Desulfovibrio sp.]
MATTNIQVRVDSDLKAEAEQLFSDIGLDMPTAVRLFLKQSIINNGIPFALERDSFYSSSNQAHLVKVARDLREGKNSAAHELIEAKHADLA